MSRFTPGGGKKNSSVAAKIIRETMKKGGRINEETFKKIMQAKLEEARANAMKGGSSMFGGMANKRQRSEKAQKAIDMMNEAADKKRQRKIENDIVIVARRLANGKIDDKGKIYDVVGNMVGKINTKTGRIVTVDGTPLGKYDPKSNRVMGAIQDAIEKVSPYLITQRQALLRQQQEEALRLTQEQEEEARRRRDGGKRGSEAGFWNEDEKDGWGGVKRDFWGNLKKDLWGNTHEAQRDIWGNVKTDIWGRPIY